MLGVQTAPLEQLPVASVSTDPLHIGVTLQLAPVVVEQVPTLPVRLQAWQAPAQAELQQTPSTQKPLVHAALPLQVAPLLGRMQVPPMQNWPVAQPVLTPEHMPRQAVAPQVNGAQGIGVGGGQLPKPSHVAAGVALFVVVLHEAAPQVVPLPGRIQLPVVVLQVPGLQIPFTGHVLLQQTPITQLPFWH